MEAIRLQDLEDSARSQAWKKINIYLFFTIWSQYLKKLKLSFSSSKEVYASKEVKENALASEGKSCRPRTKIKPQKINMPAMTSQCKTSG